MTVPLAERPDAVSDGGLRKAVLHCRACGYEAPPGDDWRRATEDGRRTVACPDCGTVVAAR